MIGNGNGQSTGGLLVALAEATEGLDGFSFVKAAKLLPAYKFTPVIMLTTEASHAMKQPGQASGAKAWMVKPFQPAQMLTAVSKLILP